MNKPLPLSKQMKKFESHSSTVSIELDNFEGGGGRR